MRRTTAALMWGVCIGAGAMLLLDPARGRRRRAVLRDKMSRAGHRTATVMASAGRDLSHRLSGSVAEARRHLRHEPVDDDVLVQRVRATLGHHATHPGAVEVSSRRGCVTLDGPIAGDEVSGLLRAVRRVPGVRGIDNRLRAPRESSPMSKHSH